MNAVLLPLHRELLASSRVAAWTRPSDRLRWAELGFLIGAGATAAVAVSCLDFGLRVPGHAILRAVFPMALGLSLAPRRLGGLVMGASAWAMAMLLKSTGGSGLGIGALTSLCLTGPMLDVALWRAKSGWPVYLSFAAGGCLANIGAFAVRGAGKAVRLGIAAETTVGRVGLGRLVELPPLRPDRRTAERCDLVSAACRSRRGMHAGVRVVIHVGIDDTDMPDTPGTNQLARAMVQQVADAYRCVRIIRHQLLDDPRVPFTSHNGSASILLQPLMPWDREQLVGRLRQRMLDWFVPGSDPGLCVAEVVPADVTEFALRCQRELVTQDMAHELAAVTEFIWKDSAGPAAASSALWPPWD